MILREKNLIKISHKGLFFNDCLIPHNFTKENVINLLGEPDSKEPVNEISHFTYDNLGLGIYFNNNSIESIGVDFEFREMKHSPKNSFSGNIDLLGLICSGNSFNEKTFESFESLIKSNNIDYKENYLGDLIINISYLKIQPYFHFENDNLTSFSITIDEGYTPDTGTINFKSTDLTTLLNILNEKTIIKLECLEEYEGSYQTENDISSGFLVNDFEYNEDYGPDNTVNGGDFDTNKKVYLSSYYRKKTFELEQNDFIQKLNLFIEENNDNDWDLFMQNLDLPADSHIESFEYTEEGLQVHIIDTIEEEKTIDSDGNIITYEEYEQYNGMTFKITFEKK